VISKHNKAVTFEPALQIRGKADVRVRQLGLEERTPAANYQAMEAAVAQHSWNAGPWCEGFFDVACFFVGGLARETSRPAWSKFFLGTERSQSAAIAYAHSYFLREGRRPDVKIFQAMVQRLVLVAHVGEMVLKPAGVGHDIVESAIQSVIAFVCVGVFAPLWRWCLNAAPAWGSPRCSGVGV